jgi:ubiquinone/menaquinone biosynthesis C-methylase UbiE
MSKSEEYVTADYLKKAAELVKNLKQRTYALMSVKQGDAVLDLGCGPGIDTIELARMVGEDGRVIGVDNDEKMVRQADEYARNEGLGARIIHQIGDVNKLSFDDGTFASCRAERLFQVLPASYDKTGVLDEMIRVTKKGGTIVLADTDWATVSVDFDDMHLERKLMSFFTESMRPNGYAGRQLSGMLKQSHLADIQVELFPFLYTDFSQTPFGDWLTREVLKAGIASQEEMTRWAETLAGLTETGRFYCTVNMIVVSGRKPS